MKKFVRPTGPRNNKHWTPEEDAKLKDLRLRMLFAWQIAEEMGRSVEGVQRHLLALGIYYMPRINWRKLLCEPHTIAELAETTGREPDAISKQRWRLRKLGLPIYNLGRGRPAKAGAA